MAYTVMKLGTWAPYTPETLPQDAPDGALFLRRNQDGADWYVLVQDTPLSEGRVFVTCLLTPDGYLTQAIHSDISRVFPVNCLLLQIDGVDPTDPKPWKLFEYRIFDPTERTFAPIPAPTKHSLSKSELWGRMSEQEAEAFDADLQEAPARLRQAYNSASRLDDRNTFWPELEAAITLRVGSDRAAVLLARTE